MVEPQDVTPGDSQRPSDSQRAGCCYWTPLENDQNDELAAGSSFDLWASTYINSDMEISGKNSHSVSRTHVTASMRTGIRTGKGTYKNDVCQMGRSTSRAGGGWSSEPSSPLLSLNMLIIPFLLIHLFSLRVEFSVAF